MSLGKKTQICYSIFWTRLTELRARVFYFMNQCSKDNHTYLHALAKQYAFQLPLLARLYKKKPDPESLWKTSATELLRLTSRLSQKTIDELYKRKQTIDLKACRQEIEQLNADGIQLLCLEDSNYADALRLIHEPPLLLYTRGKTELLQHTHSFMISVIGSRKVSDYGKYVTADIGRTLKFFDCTIVSGLALGVDALAHEAALENNIPTIAVLGSPLTDAGITPPRNKSLAHRILEASGLILSEYPPGTSCRPEFFPERNRIIAGLSAVTIVVEAAEKSGSLITARLATEEYRDVFAVPGQIYAPQSAGTNQLIELGMRPLSSMKVLRDYVSEQLVIHTKLDSASESKNDSTDITAKSSTAEYTHPLLKIFENPLQRFTIEELQEISGSGPEKFYVELAELEIAGHIILESDGTYKKA